MVQVSRNAALVTLTQVKPIFVNFTVPQDVTDKMRRNQATAPLDRGGLCQRRQDPAVAGKLTLIDNQIDTATGTLRLKATFENTDERLWPGQFVNARLVISTRNRRRHGSPARRMQGATATTSTS